MCRRAHKEGESCQIVSIKIYLWRVGEFYLSWGKPRFTDEALLSLSPSHFIFLTCLSFSHTLKEFFFLAHHVAFSLLFHCFLLFYWLLCHPFVFHCSSTAYSLLPSPPILLIACLLCQLQLSCYSALLPFFFAYLPHSLLVIFFCFPSWSLAHWHGEGGL